MDPVVLCRIRIRSAWERSLIPVGAVLIAVSALVGALAPDAQMFFGLLQLAGWSAAGVGISMWSLGQAVLLEADVRYFRAFRARRQLVELPLVAIDKVSLESGRTLGVVQDDGSVFTFSVDPFVASIDEVESFVDDLRDKIGNKAILDAGSSRDVDLLLQEVRAGAHTGSMADTIDRGGRKR